MPKEGSNCSNQPTSSRSIDAALCMSQDAGQQRAPYSNILPRWLFAGLALVSSAALGTYLVVYLGTCTGRLTTHTTCLIWVAPGNLQIAGDDSCDGQHLPLCRAFVVRVALATRLCVLLLLQPCHSVPPCGIYLGRYLEGRLFHITSLEGNAPKRMGQNCT